MLDIEHKKMFLHVHMGIQAQSGTACGSGSKRKMYLDIGKQENAFWKL